MGVKARQGGDMQQVKDRYKLFGSYEEARLLSNETVDFAKGSVVELISHWNIYLRMAMVKFRMDALSAETLLSELIYDFAREPDLDYAPTDELERRAKESIFEEKGINTAFYINSIGLKSIRKQDEFYQEDNREYYTSEIDDENGSESTDLFENVGLFDEIEKDIKNLDSKLEYGDEGENSDLDTDDTEDSVGSDSQQDKEKHSDKGQLNIYYSKAIKSKMEYLYQVGLSNNFLSFRPNVIELPIEQHISVNNSDVTYDISDIQQLQKGDGLDDVGIDIKAELHYLSAFRYKARSLDILRALLVLIYLEDKMSDMVNTGIDNKKILKLLLNCDDDGVEEVNKQLTTNTDIRTVWRYLHTIPNGAEILKEYVYGGDFLENFIKMV